MTSSEQDAWFDQWMRDHIAILHRVSHAFAEGSDRHDLVQELMLAVWNAAPAFRKESTAATFIYRVSHNAALTWKRTQRNYRKKIDRFAGFAPVEPHNSSSNDELLQRVYAAIRLLPPLDRSLILLSLDGVSYREMAEMHSLSESNVGVRLNRIKQRLADNLKEDRHEF